MLCRGTRAGSGGKAHDERHVHLAAQHIAELCRLVHDLLHGERREVGKLKLEHRLAARQRRANRDARLAQFRDRRVHHAVLAVAVHEVARDLEGAAIDADVLAHQENRRVCVHRLRQRFLDRLGIGQLACAHQAASGE